MVKQTWLFPAADGNEAPTAHERVLDLLRELPGVLRLETSIVSARSTGSVDIGVMLDICFSDEDAMNAAFAGPEGKRVSRELVNQQGEVIDVLVLNVTSFSGQQR
jgi:hypothetical protein